MRTDYHVCHPDWKTTWLHIVLQLQLHNNCSGRYDDGCRMPREQPPGPSEGTHSWPAPVCSLVAKSRRSLAVREHSGEPWADRHTPPKRLVVTRRSAALPVHEPALENHRPLDCRTRATQPLGRHCPGAGRPPSLAPTPSCARSPPTAPAPATALPQARPCQPAPRSHPAGLGPAPWWHPTAARCPAPSTGPARVRAAGAHSQPPHLEGRERLNRRGTPLHAGPPARARPRPALLSLFHVFALAGAH